MLKIEELSRKHNRKEFDCGVPALNQYLKKTARQHISKGISKTIAKKYPRRVPAAKLARLAVSIEHQRQGLGSLMMVNAIERTILISQNVGIIGFFVDANRRMWQRALFATCLMVEPSKGDT
jgi:tRNA(Met) C34 N-acetyltransferase TmcA